MSEGYLGNPRVKRAGVQNDWTEEMVLEYQRCLESPAHFIQNHIQIISLDEGLVPFNLRGYQEGLINHFDENRFSIVLACRQSGKSITVCAYLLWYALFHPEQTIAVLANKGATAREMLARITTMLENIPFFLQPGTKVLNKGSLEFENNSKIIASATSGSSIRGLSVNLLYLDEFAFVENAETFYTSTYPVVTSGSKSKVIITSTANGVGNMYHKIYMGAMNGTSEYKHYQIDWWDVPGRDDEWKKSTIANTSELQFEQEFGNSFLGTGNTLINANTLLGMMAEDVTWQKDSVRIYRQPVEGCKYVMTVDVSMGRGQDYSTFTIFNIDQQPFEQVATYRDNVMSPLLFPDIIAKYATAFNEALVIIENNNEGSVVCNQLYYDIEYSNVFVESTLKAKGIGVTMTKKVKRIGCSTIKELLEENKLILHDAHTIQEFTTFVSKGQSWEADGGNHDDLVMNCVMFAWFATTPFFEHLTDIELKKMIYLEQQKQIEDDVLPVGVFGDQSRAVEPTIQKDADGNVWVHDDNSDSLDPYKNWL